MSRAAAGPDKCGVLPISDGLCLRLLDKSDAVELHAGTSCSTNEGLQGAVICEGSIAGMAGFSSIDWRRRSASIGYWLAENRQGHGTITAVVRLLVAQALTTWSLDRVEIRVATENRRSRAIPERLGFKQEELLRGAELVGDRHLDLAVYARYRSADCAALKPDMP